MWLKQYKRYKEIILCTFFAILIGIVVGIVVTIFGKVLIMVSDIRSETPLLWIPFLPLAGVFIIFLYHKFSKESLKGMSLVFQTAFTEKERIPKRLIPLIIVTTWITHLFGGSAGREGVAVQLGATVGHSFGRWMKMPNNSRVLLITGMAAGFGGLFQTPIAATFFAMEVLVAGALQYEALLPALVAACFASTTSHFLGLEKFSVFLDVDLNVSISFIMKLIIIGVIFGIVGGTFAHVLESIKIYMKKIFSDSYKRIFIMGVCLMAILLIAYKGRYSGLGTNLIHACFSGETIYYYDWILKLILTILTLSIGYQGGEVTPLFAIGASLGIALGTLFGLPVMFVAALGYTAVFAGATKSLFAPILIGAEVFGTEYILYFTIVCCIAYVFNGNKTIYHLQRMYEFK